MSFYGKGATILRGNKCHILCDQTYFEFDLNELINNFSGYGYGQSLPWTLERLLWIAYLKNAQNEQCLLSTVPKDVINYIIQFC